MNLKFPVIVLLSSLFLYACDASKHSAQTETASGSFPQFGKEGHRGSRGLMPENTIPAMLRAIDLKWM
jgi:glycerophosphoryl diester phosphodiesterase